MDWNKTPVLARQEFEDKTDKSKPDPKKSPDFSYIFLAS